VEKMKRRKKIGEVWVWARRIMGKRRGRGKDMDMDRHKSSRNKMGKGKSIMRKIGAIMMMQAHEDASVRDERTRYQGVYTSPTAVSFSVSSPPSSPCLFVHTFFFFLADRADTQPTCARWEGLKDSEEKRQVLGGAKAGNGAWALAWVDTIMEVPASEGDDAIGRAAADERQRLLQLAANDLNPS
jgi:chromatin structure-remodeling complex protein RSC7